MRPASVLIASGLVALVVCLGRVLRASSRQHNLATSEAGFRALADNIAQLAWMANSKGWIFWYNKRWFEYTGTALEEMQGWGWTAVHHPEHVERVVAQIQRAWDTGMPWEDTFPLRGKDGNYRWFLSRAMPVRDEQGAISLWFGTNTDITEQRMLHEEAARANRVKTEFLAMLSHELRTPLNAILGWIRLIRIEAVKGAEIKDACDIIERNVRAQAQLIDDLLDLSKIESRTLRPEPRLVELRTCVQAAINALAPLAQARRIEIHSRLPEVGVVQVDVGRMQQVVWNLLTNAIKFSPRGAAIEVEIRRADSSVELMVRDHGFGIPPEFLPQVFERFRQADSSVTRKAGGLGIGLAIVKHLVEAQGGEVQARSAGRDRGATFFVRLPAAGAERDLPGTSERASLERAPSLKGTAVLVVDDELDALEGARRILEHCDARVYTARGADRALALIAEHQPDVLVSDIAMPGKDGYQLIRQVRALPSAGASRPQAVAVTAFARPEDRAKALACGYNAFLPKPFDPEELVRTIGRLRAEAASVP